MYFPPSFCISPSSLMRVFPLHFGVQPSTYPSNSPRLCMHAKLPGLFLPNSASVTDLHHSRLVGRRGRVLLLYTQALKWLETQISGLGPSNRGRGSLLLRVVTNPKTKHSLTMLYRRMQATQKEGGRATIWKDGPQSFQPSDVPPVSFFSASRHRPFPNLIRHTS